MVSLIGMEDLVRWNFMRQQELLNRWGSVQVVAAKNWVAPVIKPPEEWRSFVIEIFFGRQVNWVSRARRSLFKPL